MKTTFLALALGCALLFSGCAPFDPLPTKPAAAKQRISSWIPPGATVAQTTATMQARGFRCRTMTYPPARKEALLCTISGHGLIVRRQWLVKFEIIDGKVREPEIFTDLLGP